MNNLDELPQFKGPETLSNSVCQYLENAILDGRLEAGIRLVERDLAEKFNVSRPPIREAIRQLNTEGLVKIVPRKGAVVARISAKDVEEIYGVKILIEGFAAREAAKRMTEAELRKLKSLINKMALEIERENVFRYVKLAEEFHDLINKAAGNDKLYEIYKRLSKQIVCHKINYLSASRGLRRSFEEHKKIFETLSQRDPERVESCIKQHIKYAQEVLIMRIKRIEKENSSKSQN
jgi:DNA-binding GntR family transcriptional regulator